jgi:hypothetical protein
MELVTVLQRDPGLDARVSLPDRARRLPWLLAGLDVMAAAWMISAGDWLDHQSRISAVITLGGHHLVVLSLAVFGFCILAVLAPLTGGFAALNRLQLVALSIAGVVSVVAVAGVASVVALVVGAVVLVALLGRALIR